MSVYVRLSKCFQLSKFENHGFRKLLKKGYGIDKQKNIYRKKKKKQSVIHGNNLVFLKTV